MWDAGMGVGNAPGVKGRMAISGMAILYRIAEQRHPPVSSRDSGGRNTIVVGRYMVA